MHAWWCGHHHGRQGGRHHPRRRRGPNLISRRDIFPWAAPGFGELAFQLPDSLLGIVGNHDWDGPTTREREQTQKPPISCRNGGLLRLLAPSPLHGDMTPRKAARRDITRNFDIRIPHNIKLLSVGRNMLANGRGRWLAFAMA